MLARAIRGREFKAPRTDHPFGLSLSKPSLSSCSRKGREAFARLRPNGVSGV
jgi:hypothetical protein